MVRRLEGPEAAVGVGWPHARQQLQYAVGRDPVPAVVRPAQEAKQILDVRRFKEFEAAVLYVGNIAPYQLELERIAMVRAPKQHCLPAQRHALLPCRENALYYTECLRVLIEHRYKA